MPGIARLSGEVAVAHVIDQLGDIESQITELQAIEAGLKIKVIASVDAGKDAGSCYEAVTAACPGPSVVPTEGPGT